MSYVAIGQLPGIPSPSGDLILDEESGVRTVAPSVKYPLITAFEQGGSFKPTAQNGQLPDVDPLMGQWEPGPSSGKWVSSFVAAGRMVLIDALPNLSPGDPWPVAITSDPHVAAELATEETGMAILDGPPELVEKTKAVGAEQAPPVVGPVDEVDEKEEEEEDQEGLPDWVAPAAVVAAIGVGAILLLR